MMYIFLGFSKAACHKNILVSNWIIIRQADYLHVFCLIWIQILKLLINPT